MFKFKKKYSNVQVQTEVEMFEVPIEVELFEVHGLDAYPANNFLFKVAINTRKRCEICSILTIKARERCH